MLTRHDSFCERSLTPPTVHPAIELARVHANQVPTTEVSSGILAGVGLRSKGRQRKRSPPLSLAAPVRAWPVDSGGEFLPLPALRSQTHPGQDSTTYFRSGDLVGVHPCQLNGRVHGWRGERSLAKTVVPGQHGGSCMDPCSDLRPAAFKLGRTMGVRPRWRKFMQGLGEEVSLAAARVFASASPPSTKSSPI